jgi:pyruvate dehydrogenase E1 component
MARRGRGHRTRSLGVEHFRQTGAIQDLSRDSEAFVAAAQVDAPANFSKKKALAPSTRG